MAVKRRYPKQVVSMVTEDTRNYLDHEAETREVSMAVVIREMLDESRAMREREAEL